MCLWKKKKSIIKKKRFEFVKKIHILNPVKSFEYIKCQRSSSLTSINIATNYIRYNCQNIYSKSRRTETALEIKKATFLFMINKSIIYNFFIYFTNHRKNTNRVVIFSFRPFLKCSFLQKCGNQDSSRQILKTSASTY